MCSPGKTRIRLRFGSRSIKQSPWRTRSKRRKEHAHFVLEIQRILSRERDGDSENKTSVLLRYYRVFNVEQCEGLRALYGDEYKPVDARRMRIHRESHAKSAENSSSIRKRFTGHRRMWSGCHRGIALNRQKDITRRSSRTHSQHRTHIAAESFRGTLCRSSIRLRIRQQRRTHCGNGGGDACGNRWHFANDSHQFRQLFGNVDSAA